LEKETARRERGSGGDEREKAVMAVKDSSRRKQWIVYALASGACAACNGVFAKLYVYSFLLSLSRTFIYLILSSSVCQCFNSGFAISSITILLGRASPRAVRTWLQVRSPSYIWEWSSIIHTSFCFLSVNFGLCILTLWATNSRDLRAGRRRN
jgi:hypothetical protein